MARERGQTAIQAELEVLANVKPELLLKEELREKIQQYLPDPLQKKVRAETQTLPELSRSQIAAMIRSSHWVPCGSHLKCEMKNGTTRWLLGGAKRLKDQAPPHLPRSSDA